MRPVIAVDCETELIATGCRAPRLVCLSTSTDGVDAKLFAHGDTTAELARLLTGAIEGRWYLAGHNFAYFDLVAFAAHDSRLIPLIFGALDADGILDTMLIEKLIYRLLGELDDHHYALAECAQRHLGVTMDKGEDGWRLRYGELLDVPLDQWPARARDYARDDARVTWRVLRKQLDWAAELGHAYPKPLASLAGECRAAFALGLMASWGIVTDAGKIDGIEKTFLARQEKARIVMADAGLIRLGGTKRAPKWTMNTKALKARMQDKLVGMVADGYDASGWGRTDKGEISTGAQWLKRIKDPALAAVVDYKRSQKILSQYVGLLREGVDRPIQTSINTMVATGRTSSFDPNLQNLPRLPGIRECVVPRAGMLFCSVDFSAAELRSWGQACLRLLGFSKMADTFRADVNADPHATFAAEQLLRVTLDVAKALKTAKDPAFKDARQRAKAANFGFPGGMGPDRFRDNEEKNFWETDGANGLLMTREDAIALREAWYAQWPEARPYFRWVTNQLDATESGTFRGIISGAYRGGCGFSDGANNAFQENTAWGAKKSLYEVAKRCYNYEMRSVLFGSRPVIFAHDEVILEHPAEGAHEIATEQTRVMIEAFQSVHPDVPVTAEPAEMRSWCKAAEPVFDNKRRLIPWEDRPQKGV